MTRSRLVVLLNVPIGFVFGHFVACLAQCGDLGGALHDMAHHWSLHSLSLWSLPLFLAALLLASWNGWRRQTFGIRYLPAAGTLAVGYAGLEAVHHLDAVTGMGHLAHDPSFLVGTAVQFALAAPLVALLHLAYRAGRSMAAAPDAPCRLRSFMLPARTVFVADLVAQLPLGRAPPGSVVVLTS
jgi:hypothetical protein